MKKLILFIALCGALSANAQTYTYIGQRYEWLAGLFRALGLPVGDSAQFKVGQRIWQGAVYMDTVNTPASPNGFYIYEDPTGGNNPYWNLQRSAVTICGNRLLTPWNVSWSGNGFNFQVHGGQPSGQGQYQLGCSFYSADSLTVLLDPSDDDKERIDVIYLDATGIHVRKGDTATVGTAQKPSITLDEIELTFITVSPGTTQPTLTQLIVYNENTESIVTNIGSTSDANSLSPVYIGLKAVNWSNVNHNDILRFDHIGGSWNVLGFDAIVLAIQLKPTMPINTSCNIAISLRNGTTISGVEVIVPVTKTNSSTFQLISVPLSAFNPVNTAITRVEVRFLFPTAPLFVYSGFHLDYVHFVDGFNQPQQPSAPAQFTINMPTGFTVTPNNTAQSPGVFTIITEGLPGQYYTKEGWVTLPDFIDTVGALDGQAKHVDGATTNGRSLHLQRADTLYDGLLTAELFRKISRNDSVMNGSPGDTLLVKVSDSLLLIKSLIPGTNITFDVGADSIVINSTGGGTPTADEGLSVTGSNVRLFGPLVAPAGLTMERSINLRRNILHFNNSEYQTDAGGPFWQFTNRPYSPYQFFSTDTLTANDIDPPTAAMPVSGIFARRTMYLNSGIHHTQKVYGHYFGQTWDWLDTMSFRTEGADYDQATTIEHRFKPRGIGRQVMRASHGTGNDTRISFGLPSLVVNMYLDNSAGNYIYARGHLLGINPYLITGVNAADTIQNVVYYTSNAFRGFNSKVLKSYQFAPGNPDGAVFVDSSFGWFDTSSRRRSFHNGNYQVGAAGTSWASTDKFKVGGNVNITDSLTLGKAHLLGATTGTRVLVRQTSDGAVMEVDPGLVGGGGASGTDVVFVSSNYTVLPADRFLMISGTGTYTITLPAAASSIGRAIKVTTRTTGCFISPTYIYDHLGSTANFLSNWGNGTFVSDGTNWNKATDAWFTSFQAIGSGTAVITSSATTLDGGLVTFNHRTITAGTGIAVNVVSNAIEISATGGGGVTTVDPWSTTSTANGLSITGSAIKLHAASATNPGGIIVGAGLAMASGVLSAEARARLNTGITTYQAQRINIIGTGITMGVGSGDIDIDFSNLALSGGALWNGLFGGTARYSGNATLVGGTSDPVQIVSENTAPGATITMPTLSGNGNHAYFFKNEGTDDLTIARAGSDQFYTTTTVTSVTIPPGESRLIMSSGVLWHVHSGGTGGTPLTQEQVEDIAAALFTTDNGDIDFTYTDGTPDVAAQIKPGAIVNADINAGAAIDPSKIASPITKDFMYDIITMGGVSTRLNRYWWYDEFQGSQTNSIGTTNNFELASGAGANAAATSLNGTLTGATGNGYAEFVTGTTNSGKAILHGGFGATNNNIAGKVDNDYYYRSEFKNVIIPTLSDGTETYKIWIGFGQDNANTNAVWFTYTHSENSGVWNCVSYNNTTAQTTSTGTTVAANTEYDLRVEYYNQTAKFYINGSLVATHTTQVPPAAGNFMGTIAKILKSAGTTSRGMYIDAIGLRIEHENDL